MVFLIESLEVRNASNGVVGRFLRSCTNERKTKRHVTLLGTPDTSESALTLETGEASRP